MAARARNSSASLRRYEISNFARPGFESRHNAKYWDDQPFLGFGLSAHSYRGDRRWWNHDTFVAYCGRVEERGAAGAVAGERRLGPRERAAEAAFTGLRRRDGAYQGSTLAFSTRAGAKPETVSLIISAGC